jgi:polyadenylate-binding protein
MQQPKNFMTNSNQHESKNVLFISDLAENVNDTDLEMFFQDFKEDLLLIQLNRSRHQDFGSGRPGSATVIFKEFKMANKARLQLNMCKLKGKTVRIMWHERDSSVRYNNNSNLYIKSVPSQVTPRVYFEHFLTFGDIVSAKLAENDDGLHLGYGYIHFADADSITKCIEACDDKEVWTGSKLKIEKFQKKNERNTTMLNPNKNIFVKNFPLTYDEGKLRTLFGEFGKIEWVRLMQDSSSRKFAIVIFDSEDSANTAKKLNGSKIEDQELFVDNLMNKNERKRFLSSKISEYTTSLTNQFRDCNLHIRNIPLAMDETELSTAFEKYGEIKSVKIKKFILVTKEKNLFVEKPTSCGYGFVCFTNPEAAKNAKDAMQNQKLPGYEEAKRPLLVEFFMPKNERKNIFQKINQQTQKMPMMNPMLQQQQFGPNSMPFHPGMKNNKMMPMQPQMNRGNYGVNPSVQKKTTETKSADEPDYVHLSNLEDDNSKKDYLGEFIFKKIEGHELSERYTLNIDNIGKITGMILGIEDIQEIVDICRNENHLTSRINEALELLNQG